MPAMDSNQDGSEYINEIELQPPSPPTDALAINPAPYDPLADPLIGSGSYAGSFHNSPYSNHSDLSFGDDEQPLSLFDDPSHSYNPSEYDNNTSNFSSLLMFNDNEIMPNYQQMPPVQHDYRRGSFDHGSPSSNGGGESGGENGGFRSRASSVSSNPNQNQFSPSPRMDVAKSFEGMTFASPNWNTDPLPRDGRSPDLQKAQSPPRLMMPESMQQPQQGGDFPEPPMINAPDGDGNAAGPSLNIVPATPVSGGGATSGNVPFHTTLSTLNQGTALSAQQPQQWNQSMSSSNGALAPPYHDSQSQLSYDYNQQHRPDVGANGGLSNGQLQNGQNPNNYLFPGAQRIRSKSDPNLEPPNWDTSQQRYFDSDSALDDGTVHMGDVHPDQQRYSSHSPSPGAQQTTFGNKADFPSHYSFGPPGTNPMPPMHQGDPNSYLSPDMNAGLRRSNSDAGGNRPRHVRQTRSDDLRPHLFPPSAHEDFIARQYLSPQEPPPGIRGMGMGGGLAGGALGHNRRASWGSQRSERGISAGNWSGASSGRGSPYPSPNVSPRMRSGDLPPDDMGQATMSSSPLVVSKQNVTTGRTANASHKRRKQEATFVCPVPGCGSTFTRSFNLKGHIRSHNEEKPFQCHWPGCGKGFARQHDCKRHEQLHTNYRPFTCEGCSKQFARMDALNRHLRSEGGAECQRQLEANGTLPNLDADRKSNVSPRPSSQPKLEQTTGDMWNGVTV